MAPRTYLGLDLVRFAAALSVVFYHLAFWWWLPSVSPGAPIGPIAIEPFRWGWVGVQVFFVLSGFVIAFSAHGKGVGRFVIGRARRLYPVAWICATATLFGARIGTAGAGADYARSLLISPLGPWVSGVYWTLGVEVVFYAAVALCLWRRIPLIALAWLLGVGSAVLWMARAVNGAMGRPLGDLLAGFDGQLGALTLLPYGCEFALGMALWAASTSGYSRRLLALALLCVGSGVIAITASARALAIVPGLSSWHLIEPAAFWLVAVALIAASVRWNDALSCKCGRWTGPLRIVGLATYPLYLIHSEIGHRVMVLLLPLGSVVALLLAVLTVLALAFAVTWPMRPRVRGAENGPR